MDKLVVATPSNGFPLNNDDIKYFLGVAPYSNGLYQALEGMLKAYGDNFVVSGCSVSTGTMAEGWVMLDGELIKVDSHTVTDDYFVKATTYNSDGNKQTQLGGVADAYQENRATSTAASGNLRFDNRLVGSHTSVTNLAYTKVKTNETISVSVTDGSTYNIQLDTGFYEGEYCTVIMSCTSGIIRVYDGGGLLYELGVGNASIVFTYISSAWAIKTIMPDASTTSKGVVEKATLAEAQAGTANKFVDAEILQAVLDNSTTWTSLTLLNGWTGTIKARLTNGYVELIGQTLNQDSATSVTVASLVTTFKPDYNTSNVFTNVDDRVYISIVGAGTINIDRTGIGAGDERDFYMRFLQEFP